MAREVPHVKGSAGLTAGRAQSRQTPSLTLKTGALGTVTDPDYRVQIPVPTPQAYSPGNFCSSNTLFLPNSLVEGRKAWLLQDLSNTGVSTAAPKPRLRQKGVQAGHERKSLPDQGLPFLLPESASQPGSSPWAF